MAINPHRKGGPDVPVGDGGTGASTAGSALTNLGHGTTDHSAITGVGVVEAAANGVPANPGTVRIDNGTNTTVVHNFAAGVHTFTINAVTVVQSSSNTSSGGPITQLVIPHTFAAKWAFYLSFIPAAISNVGAAVSPASQACWDFTGASTVKLGRVASAIGFAPWTVTVMTTNTTCSGASTTWTPIFGAALG